MRLYVFSSTIHLKIAYNDEEGVLVTIDANLREARRIRRIIHKNILTPASRGNDDFDLDTREDEIRPTPDDEFEFLQLGENLTRSVKYGIRLSPGVRTMLMKCL